MKRIVIIADNCSAQNKIFCMMKFCTWLVEANWAGEVVLFFLVKGHTKNECDSKFNTLKQGTHGINIYPADGLNAAYTKNNLDHIDLTRIAPNSERWKSFTQ